MGKALTMGKQCEWWLRTYALDSELGLNFVSTHWKNYATWASYLTSLYLQQISLYYLFHGVVIRILKKHVKCLEQCLAQSAQYVLAMIILIMFIITSVIIIRYWVCGDRIE